MRVVVATVGSLGDVLPFLAVARALRARGHRVEFLTNPRFEDVVRRSGVVFGGIGAASDAERTESHPDLWHPIRGFGVLWRYLCVPALAPLYERIASFCAAGQEPPVVLASPLALGARVARERFPMRLLTGYLAPANIRSVGDPMFIGAWQVGKRVPPWCRRAIWRAVDVVKLEPMAGEALKPWRTRLGLPPIAGSTFGDWLHSPDGGLALFSKRFSTRPRDWPSDLRICGFAVEQSATTDTAAAPRLEEFLSAGDAPVLVYPGSANRGAFHMLRCALAAVRTEARRAVVLTTHSVQVPPLLATEMHIETAALETLLPYCRAIIHHGGVGTCAAALRFGTPQLAVPFAFDQFSNAALLAEMNGGRWVGYRDLTPESLSTELGALLRRPILNAIGAEEYDGAESAAIAIESGLRG